jgi:hypothetical protein
MGLAGAPATESISGSLPPERANVGSAVNDTTRELGGALGVAIVGSIMSSLYATQLTEALPERVPPPVLAAARQSLAAAVQASAAVADPAREAFVHAMSRASILVALVAAVGALIARRYLPGFVAPQVAGTPDGDTESEASPSPLRPRPDPARPPRSTITPLRTTALRLAAASHDEQQPGGE